MNYMIIMNKLWKQLIYCWAFDIETKLEFMFFIFKNIVLFVFLVVVEQV